jgi:hypothetical protein
MPATLKFPETFQAANQVIPNAAKSTTYNCTCTCPNGEVYQVGDENEACAKLACHFGATTSCDSASANSFAGSKVICGKVFSKKDQNHSPGKSRISRNPQVPREYNWLIFAVKISGEGNMKGIYIPFRNGKLGEVLSGAQMETQ